MPRFPMASRLPLTEQFANESSACTLYPGLEAPSQAQVISAVASYFDGRAKR